MNTTAEKGVAVVIAAIQARGGSDIDEERQGHRRFIHFLAPDGRRVTVIVKSRKSGTWQASVNDGDPSRSEEGVFWVFVDVEDPKWPLCYIVPDPWVRDDICENHHAYLERHGGERAVTKESTHHAIDYSRIREWRGRWDLLGLA